MSERWERQIKPAERDGFGYPNLTVRSSTGMPGRLGLTIQDFTRVCGTVLDARGIRELRAACDEALAASAAPPTQADDV